MRFMIEQLLYVHAPGTNVCIHCQQLLSYKVQHGFQGRRDFRGALVEMFSAGGFHWIGEFAIAKDPQAIANRMNLHSLQFKTGYGRDSNKLAPVFNDYVLIFQKPGDAEFPVRPIIHKKNPGGWITTDEWVRDAHGIWTDILEIDVIDGGKNVQKALKEDKYERHVCPLQLSVISRLVRLYSNPISVQPNVTVLDPFMGVGSVGYCALNGKSPITKQRVGEARNVVGFELKESYHRQAIKNCELALQQQQEAEAAECDLFSQVEAVAS